MVLSLHAENMVRFNIHSQYLKRMEKNRNRGELLQLEKEHFQKTTQ